MTENTNNTSNESSEETTETSNPTSFLKSILGFGPQGLMELNIEDVPMEVRHQVAQAVSELPGFPEAIKARIYEQLEIDPQDLPAPGEGSEDDHEHHCGHEEHHYIQAVWETLDSAFPNQPHLWNAAEVLLMLGSKNPAPIQSEQRLGALTTAINHLTAQYNLEVDKLNAALNEERKAEDTANEEPVSDEETIRIFKEQLNQEQQTDLG